MEGNRKILLCDDQQGMLEVTEIILSEEGYDVQTLSNGRNIVEEAEKLQPMAILIDLRMPFIEGDKATILLKSNPRTMNIPVVIFSASHKGKNKALEAGADAFLQKPFEIEELINTIESVTTR